MFEVGAAAGGWASFEAGPSLGGGWAWFEVIVKMTMPEYTRAA